MQYWLIAYKFNTHTVPWRHVKAWFSSDQTISTGSWCLQTWFSLVWLCYTADFQYNTNSRFMQKFSDDTAVVSLKGDDDEEYRGTVDDFVEWSEHNHLHLNTTKTKVGVDFRRGRKRSTPIPIRGTEVEVVANRRYVGVQLDSGLDWRSHMEAVCRKGQARLCSVYHSVVASALFFAVAWWGEGVWTADQNRLDMLIMKAGSVVGAELQMV